MTGFWGEYVAEGPKYALALLRTLFDWLETETLEEFLDNFPSVSRA